jgi:acyl carrier protein
MTKQELYWELEEILEIEKGTIHGDQQLASLQAWDSLATMGFIAMVDRKFGITVPANAIAACQTVEDLTRLLGPYIEN